MSDRGLTSHSSCTIGVAIENLLLGMSCFLNYKSIMTVFTFLQLCKDFKAGLEHEEPVKCSLIENRKHSRRESLIKCQEPYTRYDLQKILKYI